MKKTINPPEVDDETLNPVSEPDAEAADPTVGEAAAPVVGTLNQVTAQRGLNLRADPGREHRVLRVLTYGSVVEVRGAAVTVAGVDWLPVQDGWVDASFLTPVASEV